MRKEFGKWLLDIAKYLVTVLLLSSLFADMDRTYMYVGVSALVIFIFIVGLYLVDDDDKNNKTNKKKGN